MDECHECRVFNDGNINAVVGIEDCSDHCLFDDM